MRYRVRFMLDWYTTHFGPIEVIAPTRGDAIDAAMLEVWQSIQEAEPGGCEVEHEVVAEGEADFDNTWWEMEI